MDLIAELHRSNLDSKVVSMLLAKLEQSQQEARRRKALSEQSERDAIELKRLAERVQRDAAYIKVADTKIAALTLELAHHKRIRFSNRAVGIWSRSVKT